MKSKAIFMALLAFAFGAQAVPIDVEKAKLAARAWAYRGATLGARLGDTVERATTHLTSDGVPFYAITMKGGGVIFMSSDTEVEPIICFTSDSAASSELDQKSPLWALLNADISNRRQKMAQVNAAGGSAVGGAQSRTSKLWAELIEEGEAVRPALAPAIIDGKNIGDLRVAPLVQSQWSQSTANGKACWNYYTPPGPIGRTQNAVCGCVATAMSQVMRYHKFPNDTVNPVTHTCSYNERPIDLTTQAGTYDWDAMTLKPNLSGSSMTAANYQAIGKLVSDAGITVYMEYSDNGSGAFGFDITYALMHHWHYKNSVFFDTRLIEQTPGSSERDQAFQKALFANFDAGYPVSMGIPGHAIVADGYGYNNDYDYVHLNMGWAGQCDYWYNLPDMSAAGSQYRSVEDINYNIFPDKDKTYGIISGRITDAETGLPLEDVEVTLKAKSGGAEIKVRTSSRGIYGAAVKAGRYAISAASLDGTKTGVHADVTVSAPSTTPVNWNGLGRLTPSVGDVSDLGNSWGNDISLEDVLYEGSVKNMTRKILYGTLDAALDEAQAGDEIAILSETLLRYPQNITKNVRIHTAMGVDLANAVIHCRTAAVHGFTNVANGVTLTLENLVFGGTQGCFVRVSSGGVLALSGMVGLSDGSYIYTEDETGIYLAGELMSFLTIDCLAARTVNTQFGTYAPGTEGSAAHFLNPYDEDLGGVASDGLLIWGRVPVDPSIAIAYFTGDEGANKQYYRNVSKLFDDHKGEVGDVVILKDCVGDHALEPNRSGNNIIPWEVTYQMRICSTNEVPPALNLMPETYFAITGGGSLTLSNVVISGHNGTTSSFLLGDWDESDNRLILDAGARLSNLKTRDPDEIGAGAVMVTSGTLTMKPGSVIENCETITGYGGAVALWGPSCILDLQGGSITGCYAGVSGGGVYAYSESVVNLSGDAIVKHNTYRNVMPNDVHAIDSSALVRVVGELTSPLVSIGVYYEEPYDDFGNEEGKSFAYVSAALSDPESTAKHFFSDVNSDLLGLPSSEGDLFVWKDMEGVCDPSEASAWLIYPQTATTNYYKRVHYAFDAATNDAIVVMVKDDNLPKLINIQHDFTLRSKDDDSWFILGREALVGTCFNISAPHTLHLENVCLEGGENSGGLIDVNGGTLTMGTNAVVFGVLTEEPGDAAILVYNGGRFEMLPGAGILECYNFSDMEDDDVIYGPALNVSSGTAIFTGGEIWNYSPEYGVGAYIGAQSTASISGNTIIDNLVTYYEDEDHDNLVLNGDFTGQIYVMEMTLLENSPTNIFGVVDDDYLATAGSVSLANSATRFFNSFNLDYGCAVTNATSDQALLVWSQAIEDGKFVADDGTEYYLVNGGTPPPPPPPSVAPPTAVEDLIYTGYAQTGVVASVGFTLTDNIATNAGNYQATAKLEDGYVWKGGGTEDIIIDWVIAKAMYNMSGVVFTNVTFVCDGAVKSNLVDEATLPEGVSVTNYLNNGQAEVGEYLITAQFGGDAENYEPIADMTARLTIVDPPSPEPIEIDPPVAVTGLIYDGTEQTGVVASVGFTLTDNIATNAGNYQATAKLEDGYVWKGGGAADLTIDWVIAKATYDMSGVVFTNVTFVCDGAVKSNLVDEATLPEGVSVTNYLNNGQTEVGEYTVTAQFGGDAENYEPIADMTALLIIIENPTPPPPPPPSVITNYPLPIAFSKIQRISNTEWQLCVTNCVEWCRYRLIYTDDISRGFLHTGEWVQVSADVAPNWTTNVVFSAKEVKPAFFWRAQGTWGIVPSQQEGE